MLQARQCRRCWPVAWRKVRPPGSRCSRFECLSCGGPTKRIKRAPGRKPAVKGLTRYRELVEDADALWRKLIYAKTTDGRCVVNLSHQRGLQAMHLFPKGHYPHLRHDPENGAPGCPGCHIELTNDHEKHRNFCIRFLGPARYERLRLRSLSVNKVDVRLSILELTELNRRLEVKP